MFERIAELRAEGNSFALATVTWRRGPSSARVGSRAIVHPDGRVEGWMGGACSQPTLVDAALDALRTGQSRLVVLGEHDHRESVINVPMACASEGAMEVYMEPVLPNPAVHVVGSSPMTSVLAELLNSIGWRATSTEQTNMDGVDAATHIVIATQGHFDEQAIQAALATQARSIGLVASEKRATSVFEWLRENGESDEQIGRVRAPVGLDLGSTDHAGMAVAILAELVRLEAGANPVVTEISSPQQAVDPVCGMLVDVSSARWTHRHSETDYYFCAPGCHKAFSSDPAAYL